MKKNIREVTNILGEIYDILESGHRRKAVRLIIILIIASFFELLGVSAILPFMQVIMDGDAMLSNPYVKTFAPMLGIKDAISLTAVVGIGLIGIYIIKNLYLIFSYYMRYSFAAGVQKSVSDRLLESYLLRRYEYFLNTNSAEIVRNCTEDTEYLYNVVEECFAIIGELFTILTVGIFVILTDPFIALGIIGLMAIVFCGILFFFKPQTKKAGKRNIQAVTDKNKAIYQACGGIKEIMVMQRKENFLQKFYEATTVKQSAVTVFSVLKNIPDRIVEGVCIGGIIGIVVIKILVQGADVSTLVPVLGAFAIAAFRLLPSVGKITGRINSIIYYRPSLKQIYENLKIREEILSKTKVTDASEKLIEALNPSFEDSISVKNISFAYENSEKLIIKDLNLEIQKGESVAFIGESGSGKTTLSDIILGLLRPEKGSVYVDEKDVYNIPIEWSRLVGYVPQSVFLLDDTIRENVAFGDTADDERIWDALDQAMLSEHIRSLPEGLDTMVGEMGVRLSGGQRQRIAIARALYHNPEILILDEATAALDTETETAVMESVEALQGRITMIIVAHRLSTIRKCDRVFEIKDGKAISRPRYEE